jgi:hypothetical protein
MEARISRNVRAVWGYPDGHVAIFVRVPIPIPFVGDPEVELRIEPEEIQIVREMSEEAEAWLQKIRR